ncbi:hypothetical protein EIP91_009442 [Steccherinum ochraceum]|uniref:DUF1264-domain-containing protein n=1 Tax=Steccherinum ochraceum TaxID=92696 RepID=A0A4R0RP11_9APHY|nr:hypothetical protein EIP91_009442 [Steccherinum ochraceum]
MDTESKRASYHTASYQAAGSAMMSFTPIGSIHQHLCAFHVYSNDRSRHVRAHHFCVCRSKDFHQCIIYDSDKADARLIGIEYIVSEKIFVGLPEDEKKYWHSHKYEVESGLLQLRVKDLVPNAAVDVAEQPAMLELQQTYGKTIHTWASDIHPDLPLGPPNLMMAYTQDGQGPPPDVLKERDEHCGMDTPRKKSLRAEYLPTYETVKGSDEWEHTGKAVSFEPVEREIQKQ